MLLSPGYGTSGKSVGPNKGGQVRLFAAFPSVMINSAGTIVEGVLGEAQIIIIIEGGRRHHNTRRSTA
jgi:hypothetical protein